MAADAAEKGDRIRNAVIAHWFELLENGDVESSFTSAKLNGYMIKVFV